MWKTIRLCIIAASLAFLCLCWPSAGSCSESQTYTISATQLEALQNHLTALEQNNSELLSLLDASEMDLTEASQSLSASKKELETLRTQLTALQAETRRLDESLRIANAELQNARESFRQSEQEHDRIEGRLRTQRNVWEVLFFLAAGVAATR